MRLEEFILKVSINIYTLKSCLSFFLFISIWSKQATKLLSLCLKVRAQCHVEKVFVRVARARFAVIREQVLVVGAVYANA